MQEMQVRSLGQKDPLEKKRQPTPVFLSRKFMDREAWWATIHGVIKQSDTTGCTHTHTHTHSYYLICTELICTVKIVYSSWKKRCTILKKSKLRNVINIQIMRYIYLFVMNLENER